MNQQPNLPKLSHDVLTTLPEAVMWFDEKAKLIDVNEIACQNWGYTREEFLTMSIFDVNPNMDPKTWHLHWAAKIKDPSTFESTHRRKNGEIFPVGITDNFVNFNGVIYCCAIIRDLTEQKVIDRVARLSDFTVRKANDAIFWLCPKGFIKHTNEAACQQYGYEKYAFEKMNINIIFTDEEKSSYEEFWNTLKEKGKHIHETQYINQSTQIIPVEVNTHYIEFEGMEYACMNVRDISDRKRKEAALRGALMEIRELKEKLEAENNYLQEEIELQSSFGDIVSESKAFKKVLKQIEQVADTTSTVLVTGESGTGKELIARALHQLSSRSGRPMIKVNCAALPPNLIESELFGHEKGAFTGAIQRKIGKFELADGGTLFLDEIGEMPIELQAKLLRALQEGEIERVGGNEMITVDVRIIAATNRNLLKQVEKGEFREDLYYRLNVFPIHSIPLRDRKEDIPPLVRFFCEKLCARLGRPLVEVPRKVIDKLLAYDFPGNIRELENIIERGIITARAGKLNLGSWFVPKKKKPEEMNFASMEELQKQHIINVLKHTNWRVSGENGAAAILGMRPTTLYSRIEKLAIKRSNDAL